MITVKSIREGGANNILKWAIANGADIRNEPEIQQLINEETYYSLTLENVNFLELFRLSQALRNKIRIVDEHKASILTRRESTEAFPGELIVNEGEENQATIEYYQKAEEAVEKLLNVAVSMNSDDDIIQPSAARLYLPMISRKFDVQVPITFNELLKAIPADVSTGVIFNQEYPNTLNLFFDDERFSLAKTMLLLGIVPILGIIRYSKKLNTAINITKFDGLKKIKSESLIKFKMTGFKVLDNISRNEIRCDMFKATKEYLVNCMKRVSRVSNPLKVEFAVQMPIQYMCDLCKLFGEEDLQINFHSSMSDIISAGIPSYNFKSFELEEGDTDYDIKLEEYNNAISEYNTRIADAITTTTETIGMLMNSNADDIAVFSLLPSIYMTRAIITVNVEKFDDVYLSSGYSSELIDMFSSMREQCNSLVNEISKNK